MFFHEVNIWKEVENKKALRKIHEGLLKDKIYFTSQ